MKWEQILPGVWQFRDSCNVYAVEGERGMLVIDAGTGRWLEHVRQLPGKPVALALTHYFRDHAAGAVAAARAGIAVYVPHGEREILADPAEHFRRRSTYIIYDNLWDLFVPIEPLPDAKPLLDYDRTKLAGIDVEIIPLPGVTLQQIGLAVRLSDGRETVFCGEAIHSPGRLYRIAPLQYDYNDLGGAINCYYSAQVLRDRKAGVLLPSVGEPIDRDTDAALAQLQQNMRALCAGRAGMTERLDAVHGDPLIKVTDHVWRSAHSNSYNWFIISDSGKAMVIDYGYQWNYLAQPMYSTPAKRRALLHGLDGLKKRFGIDRVDVVLVSHFHDDHVCGIPHLQRLHDAKCWAAENFADLLEKPEAHIFPCTWPVPIRVDRRLPLDQPVRWEEYTFHLHPMNGHTRFSALIGFEADGKRFAHTGDQYFFIDVKGNWQPERFDFATAHRMQNHVYRNGALVDGFDISGKWILKWRPEIVLQGHQNAFVTDEHFFRHIEQWAEDYKHLHRTAMVLGESDTHFNLDSWGGWIWPYRTHLKEPGAAKITVTVRNPLPRRAKLQVKLVGPAGWTGTSATLDAPPRAEMKCELQITPAGPCRRQPFAVDLVADGQPFGQVAEAILSVGGAEF